MFAGHFAVAAAVKARDNRTPMWALMLGTQLLDVLFVPMLLSGIETIESVGTGHGAVIIHADYTHALATALVLALVAGLLAWRAWGRRSGITLGAVVFSHWVLDLLVHRSDLPILPGNPGHLPLLRLGLWRSAIASSAVEGLLVVAGAFLYGRSVLSRGPRRYTLTAAWVVGALLVLSLITDFAGIG